MIKAICTDFGGVLFPTQPYIDKPTKERLSELKAIVIDICRKREGEIKNCTYSKKMFENDLQEFTNEKEHLIYKSITDVNLEYLELLESLSDNYKLYALINEAPRWTELRMYFLYKNPFCDIFISSYIGSQKPDREAYEYFLRNTKLLSSEVIFIDDDVSNIETANDLGFETILYKNNEQVFSEIDSKRIHNIVHNTHYNMETFVLALLPCQKDLEILNTLKLKFNMEGFRHKISNTTSDAHITLAHGNYKDVKQLETIGDTLEKIINKYPKIQLNTFELMQEKHEPNSKANYINYWLALKFKNSKIIELRNKLEDYLQMQQISTTEKYIKNVHAIDPKSKDEEVIGNHINLCNYCREERVGEAVELIRQSVPKSIMFDRIVYKYENNSRYLFLDAN